MGFNRRNVFIACLAAMLGIFINRGAPVSAAAAPDIKSAHAFPMPFKPSLGHNKITFRGLTARVKIKIYTLSGELVKELEKDNASSQDLVWSPVTNWRGEALASGIYLYVIKTDNDKKTGKLFIIR
ncbi:MAG: T9SS type A sorting domain-containing protein [Elusimicrobia bacterium]|nr:T9SS type A sorting domain-containing protein [Elusimicrobiota bacterium]